jgi:Kae1-associated kinase Bud32
MKLIAQGAEAKIYRDKNKLIKDRIKKSYRLQVIDSKLRISRTKAEARLISRAARAGVPVPRVIDVGKTKLEIEFLDGPKLRDWIDSQKDLKKVKKVLKELGKLTDKMHAANVIHGDMTTSNIIYLDKPYFIDFGLGTFSERLEDKAVDLHLFKECLKSKHYEHWLICWKAFKQGYKNEKVFEQLEKVESRGRYKKGL